MLTSANRFEKGYYMLSQWLAIKQKGNTLVPYFEDNMIQNIAIYGMGIFGERLYEELQCTTIEISYAIDRMASMKHIENLKIYQPNEIKFPKVDAIVITPIHEYWNIAEQLENKINTSFDTAIVSLEDIVSYCMEA